MIRTLFIVVATMAALVAVSIGYVVATGLSARAKPGSIETRLARAARGLAIPSEIRTKANPIAPGPKAVAAGMKIGVAATNTNPTITSERSRSFLVGCAPSSTAPV